MKSEYQTIVILRIKKLREERGISQKRLGAILGITNGHIGNIESTKMPHKYTLEQISIICRDFSYPIEKVFLGNDTFVPPAELIIQLINKIIEYERK